MSRYHRTDAWRGYSIPDLAIAGSSYTGEWEDSPCPAKYVKPELTKLQDFLKTKGIDTKIKTSESSNVFMTKLWIVVKNPKQFDKAGSMAENWLKKHENDTRFIHDADIPKGKKKVRSVS